MSDSGGRPGGAGAALLGLIVMAVIAGVMVTVGVAPAIALTSVGAKNSIGLFENLPSDLKIDPLQQGSTLYARSHGKNVKIATFYSQNRVVIPWSEVGANAKIAAVAGEDVRFYQHGGVDPTGIVRAAIDNLLHKPLSGASTITQQYVKNVCEQEAYQITNQAKSLAAFEDCEGIHLDRKLREMRYAIGLEKKYTKDQILLGYLNIALFGGNIYGIEAAAEYYYGVHAKDLTVSQAASLIAIVNAPNALNLDQKSHLAANTARRNYILGQEIKYKMITQAQYEAAINTVEKPKITPTQSGCQAAGVAGYFCDYVEHVIDNSPAFGSKESERIPNLESDGYKIYTPLNLDLERKAQATMNEYVPMKWSSAGELASAASTVQPGTGRILTMVQSKIFDNSKDAASRGSQYQAVNYNTDEAYGGSAGFQPGSTYKLFTLLDWLKKGHGLYESVLGSPRTIPASDFTECGSTYVGDPWPVGNDEASEKGFFSVMAATAQSVNGAFASMGEKLDLCDIRDTAKSLGVHRADGTPLQDYPPTIIGTNEVAPLTMAAAYAAIAAQGKYCPPVAIDRVIKTDGSQLALPATTCTQGVDKSVAIAAGYALHGVLQNGTAAGDASGFGAYAIAKTGTTDSAKATWEVGGTNKAVTAVWVGNVVGNTNLREVYSFPTCHGTGQAAESRHCLWTAMMNANNAVYPGSTSWPQVDQQYLTGAQTSVPNVAGLSVSAATGILTAAGFQVKVGEPTGSNVPAGSIASSNPAAGSQAPAGSTITILPSNGTAPAVNIAPVPSAVGLSLSAAASNLRGAGFTNATVNYVQGTGACTVEAINPVAGSQVPVNTQISLTVLGTAQPVNGSFQCP